MHTISTNDSTVDSMIESGSCSLLLDRRYDRVQTEYYTQETADYMNSDGDIITIHFNSFDNGQHAIATIRHDEVSYVIKKREGDSLDSVNRLINIVSRSISRNMSRGARIPYSSFYVDLAEHTINNAWYLKMFAKGKNYHRNTIVDFCMDGDMVMTQVVLTDYRKNYVIMVKVNCGVSSYNNIVDVNVNKKNRS